MLRDAAFVIRTASPLAEFADLFAIGESASSHEIMSKGLRIFSRG